MSKKNIENPLEFSSHIEKYSEMEDEFSGQKLERSQQSNNNVRFKEDNEFPTLEEIKDDLLDETSMAQINTLNEPVAITIVYLYINNFE